MNLCDLTNQLCRADRVPEPPSGHRIRLGKGSRDDDTVPQFFRNGRGCVRLAPIVEKPLVALVGQNINVVLRRELADSQEFGLGYHCPGRIAGIAEEEGLRPWRDRRLDGRGIEREVILEPGRDVDRAAAREHDRGDV